MMAEPQRKQRLTMKSRSPRDLLSQLEQDLQGLERLRAMETTLLHAIREQVAELSGRK